jgi:hypothetical protein
MLPEVYTPTIFTTHSLTVATNHFVFRLKYVERTNMESITKMAFTELVRYLVGIRSLMKHVFDHTNEENVS